MTLDEARLTLKELRFYPSLDDFDVEALNIAIKAVEAMQNIKGVNTVKLHDDALTILSICDILEEVEK